MKDTFLATLLWTSSDDDNEQLDSIYSIADIDNPNVIDSIIDRFIAAVESDSILISLDNITQVTGNDTDRIAHDLCLTINHHGAGFWDGDYSPDRIISGDMGDRLTAICHQFNEIGLYVNDRDRLSIETY